MKHQKFTISEFYDHEKLVNEETGVEVIPKSGYNTVKEIEKWCKINHVCISLVLITQWDLGVFDAYGIPEILASVNLDLAIRDKVNELYDYQY